MVHLSLPSLTEMAVAAVDVVLWLTAVSSPGVAHGRAHSRASFQNTTPSNHPTTRPQQRIAHDFHQSYFRQAPLVIPSGNTALTTSAAHDIPTSETTTHSTRPFTQQQLIDHSSVRHETHLLLRELIQSRGIARNRNIVSKSLA